MREPPARSIEKRSAAIRRAATAFLTTGCLGVALAVGLIEPASAHTRSASYSRWDFTDDAARVQLRIPMLQLTRLGVPMRDLSDAPALYPYFLDHLVLRRGGRACPPDREPRSLQAKTGWVRVEWHVACEAAGAFEIESRLLLESGTGHTHFARADFSGAPPLERVLTASATRWQLGRSSAEAEARGSDAATGSSVFGYIALGVEHMLSGWDHLAFVLALLLVATTFREVAALVTGFTFAHSVTLGLAMLRVLEPDAGAIEALIGFSIALVAAENAWLLAGRGRSLPVIATVALVTMATFSLAGVGAVSAMTLIGLALFSGCHFGLLDRVSRPARLRVAVAFAFGLVHGFGFAGILGEMDLVRERLVPALFGFNLGIELGQLAVVAIAWPTLRWLDRRGPPDVYRLTAELGSAAICGLGLFWFVTRSYG